MSVINLNGKDYDFDCYLVLGMKDLGDETSELTAMGNTDETESMTLCGMELSRILGVEPENIAKAIGAVMIRNKLQKIAEKKNDKEEMDDEIRSLINRIISGNVSCTIV
jgi:hypothetical protein